MAETNEISPAKRARLQQCFEYGNQKMQIGVYISGQENFQNISIADIDFGRLYVFLTNVHNNEFDQYWE